MKSSTRDLYSINGRYRQTSRLDCLIAIATIVHATAALHSSSSSLIIPPTFSRDSSASHPLFSTRDSYRRLVASQYYYCSKNSRTSTHSISFHWRNYSYYYCYYSRCCCYCYYCYSRKDTYLNYRQSHSSPIATSTRSRTSFDSRSIHESHSIAPHHYHPLTYLLASNNLHQTQTAHQTSPPYILKKPKDGMRRVERR